MNRAGRQGAIMELERRMQQLKEVFRVSAALRVAMSPEAICSQVVQAIYEHLGFHAAVVNLFQPGSPYFMIAATAGISEPEHQRLVNDPPPVEHIRSLMRPAFLLSRSYFIDHDHKYLLEGIGGILLLAPPALATPRGPGFWHPDDVFFTPMNSARDGRLLGFISLDLPEDGRTPTEGTAEIIEMLADQAASALETAWMFQERERERQALDYGLAELLAHLERMRQRDFSARAQLRVATLNHVAGALNDVSATLGNVLADVRDAGMVMQQQATEMRATATDLAASAQRQAEQIRSVSEAVQRTSSEMHQIVEQAADSSSIAAEAEDISHEGHRAAEQATEGMSAVREITLQAAKRIKRLGESSQDISQVAQLVSEFASQTHLLALNAAIEAANAGEHGNGFAIVAREIRTLAQNSNDATKQIQFRVKGIQNETNQVAITIDHATEQVVMLSDLVLRSSSALDAIDASIQRIIGVIATVHQTAAEQAQAASAVSDTMNMIAGITGNTWESAEQMRAAIDHLVELAGILQTKIALFRLGEHLQADLTTTPPPISSVRTTATPAASFPAVSLPGASQPSQLSQPSQPSYRSAPPVAPSSPSSPSFAASYPPTAVSGAPVSDAVAGAASVPGADMALLETMPMPAIPMTQAPHVPSATSTAISGETPAPAPMFPASASAFAPMRIAALDEDQTGHQTNETNETNAASFVPANGEHFAAHDTADATNAPLAQAPDEPDDNQPGQAPLVADAAPELAAEGAGAELSNSAVTDMSDASSIRSVQDMSGPLSTIVDAGATDGADGKVATDETSAGAEAAEAAEENATAGVGQDTGQDNNQDTGQDNNQDNNQGQ